MHKHSAPDLWPSGQSFDSRRRLASISNVFAGVRATSRKTLPLLAVALLVLAVNGKLLAQQPYADSGYSQDDAPVVRQPLNAGQLEQLVAPIALYPDPLVAQVLAASTYPAQVVEADQWRRQRMGASPEEIVAGADVQPWDPSVKALTAFPQVLEQMARNLQWTTDLGNAYFNQPQDVIEAVQVMRRRAQAAGNLQSTPQEIVRYQGDYIELASVNPEIVYVPAYNPWAVYGEPVTPYPGFSLLGAIGEFFTSSPLRYGLGIAMSAFAHTPWGWLAWGLDWLVQAVLFNHSDYSSHSDTVADWGFPHHRFYAYQGHGFARLPHEYARLGSGEGWRHGRTDGGGWHTFGRSEERHAENWGERSSRGFESFRGGNRSLDGTFSRPDSRTPESRATSRYSFGHEERNGELQSYRAANGNFAHAAFDGRSSNSFSRSSEKSSQHSGGIHLFGGGHAQESTGGGHARSSDEFHSNGRAPKNFGRGKGFSGGHVPKGFGSGKSFGGGHSHGGGSGHSGGHGGGKHHR